MRVGIVARYDDVLELVRAKVRIDLWSMSRGQPNVKISTVYGRQFDL